MMVAELIGAAGTCFNGVYKSPSIFAFSLIAGKIATSARLPTCLYLPVIRFDRVKRGCLPSRRHLEDHYVKTPKTPVVKV
ncbi:hypothetical protein ANO14919_059110 [Xylariales sp. No.14919]|nr:hypothetical protein ANO14919_059110 [Xylariales sp. No.14919]